MSFLAIGWLAICRVVFIITKCMVMILIEVVIVYMLLQRGVTWAQLAFSCSVCDDF